MEIEEDTPEANPASVKSDDSSPRTNSGRGSPPPNCAICLGNCKNKSFTDSCLHQFCFSCLLTWSKVKAECPLCKQNFKSIIHNVRSNHQYEEYMVEQRTEEVVERIDISNFTAQARRFRYRTTLTLPRRDSMAIQRLLLLADVYPRPTPPCAPLGRRRRSPASFRRTVYRHALWARPLPDFTGRFRDCSPEFYRYNDAQMHRLVPWINRELHYLLNENVAHISYVLTRILELLPQYHINSAEFREALFRYFGDRTEHFLHELYCFASTPYDMPGYDRNVQYTTDPRISTMVNEVISSSESDASVDSDIVMVSHSEAPPAAPAAAAASTSIASAAASVPGPSRAPPHDSLYGISYNIPEHSHSVVPIETISHSDTDDDSEVMVVGYIKPPEERTPEVVDLLGSDSDVVVQDASQAGPSQASDLADARGSGAPLVKLTLKRHVPAESDSDDSFVMVPQKRSRMRDSPRWSTSSSSSSSLWSSSSSSSSTSSFTSYSSDSSELDGGTAARDAIIRDNINIMKAKLNQINEWKARTRQADKSKRASKSKSQKRKKSQSTRSKNKDRKSIGKKSTTRSSKKADVSVQCLDRALAVAPTPSTSVPDSTYVEHHHVRRNLNQSNSSEAYCVIDSVSGASFSAYDLGVNTNIPKPLEIEQSRENSSIELEHPHNEGRSTSGHTSKTKNKFRNNKRRDDEDATNRTYPSTIAISPMPSTSEQFSSEILHTAMDNILNQPCTSGYNNKIKIKRRSHRNKEIWENEANTSTLSMSPKPSTSEQGASANVLDELEAGPSQAATKAKKKSHKRKGDEDNKTRKTNKGKKKKSKRSTSRQADTQTSRKHKNKRSSSGENRRLRSVVNVMNSNQSEGPSESPSNSNGLNTHNGIHSNLRRKINSEIFKLDTPESPNVNNQSNETETDDDLPLNYSLK